MMFNRAHLTVGRSDRASVPIIDPLRSGSAFYEVEDPYEAGRKRQPEQVECEVTPTVDQSSTAGR